MRDKAQKLLEGRRFGTLATQSKRLPGYPFASVVNYALDASGRPIFFFSSLAVHSKNLKEDPCASFLVFSATTEENAMTTERLTLLGDLLALNENERDVARTDYLAKHPEAIEYIDFGDFTFYWLQVKDSYYVGGFGEMGWIPS
jgi:putative heme iron utilization protein